MLSAKYAFECNFTSSSFLRYVLANFKSRWKVISPPDFNYLLTYFWSLMMPNIYLLVDSGTTAFE